MITCVLLAAGYSERFGSPKALANINNTNVIGHLQEELIDSNINNVTVVLGAHAEKIEPFLLKHKKVKSVYNKDHKSGQTSSFKAGLAAISKQTEAVMLLPVDFPLITRGLINEILDFYKRNRPLILIPTFNGIKGHPPVFHKTLFREFLDLNSDAGLNEVAHAHEESVLFFPVDSAGVIASFNTPEEWEHIKKNF